MEFVVNGSDKCTDGVEIKFSDFFLRDDLQMWGCKPMLRNLIKCLKKRTNNKSMDSLLFYFLCELHGDCAQTIQLCAAMEYVDKKDTVVKPVSLSELNNLLTIDTSNHSMFSSSHGYVQSLLKDAISMCYGCYNCLHSPLHLKVVLNGLHLYNSS